MEIADELNRLQKLSAEKKLTPSDFKNGTFTYVWRFYMQYMQ